MQDRASKPVSSMIKTTVDVRLNWSEYVHGKWTAPAAADTSTVIVREVGSAFDSARVLVYVAPGSTADGSEALLVCVHGDTSGGAGFQTPAAFRIASKNSPPTVVSQSDTSVPLPPHSPYGAPPHFDSTLRVSDSSQLVLYQLVSTPQGGGTFSLSTDEQMIIKKAPSAFELLLTDDQLDALGPFFYEDEQNTFFVQPELAEKSVSQWEEWAIPPPGRSALAESGPADTLPLAAAVPDLHIEGIAPIDPRARYEVKTPNDWVTHPDNVVQFGDTQIGREGGLSRAPAAPNGPPSRPVSGNGHLPIQNAG